VGEPFFAQRLKIVKILRVVWSSLQSQSDFDSLLRIRFAGFNFNSNQIADVKGSLSKNDGAKSQGLPDVLLENFEASKVSIDKLIDDFTKYIIDSSETALRWSNPKFGELGDEVRLGLIWHVVRKLPSNCT